METTNRRAIGLALIVGYLGVLLALVVAHLNPATGYELSIYDATPTAVWAGLGVGAVVGVIGAFATGARRRYHHASLLLLGLSALSLVAMPVIRGYHFYGAGDSLTHLGWAKEIANGSLAPTELLYPGVHSIAVLIKLVTGAPLTDSMLYTASVAFPLVFLLTVPLIVRVATSARWGYAVGLAAAALFVPVNNISVHPSAHPTSQAILFLPFVLLVALTYVFDPAADALASASGTTDRLGSPAITDGGDRDGVTGIGILLGLISAAVVLFHPQQALNVLLVFLAVTAFQLLYSRWGDDTGIANHRWLGVQTGVLALLFLTWAPRFERTRDTVAFTVMGIFSGSTSAGTVVASKASSLTAIGGSISLLFVKLFLAGAVLALVTGIVLVVGFSGRFEDDWTDSAVRYLGVSLIPLGGIFLVVLAIGAGDMYFRYQGFMMVFVTVLGAVGLAVAIDGLDTRLPEGAGRVLVVVLLLALVPVAALGYHSSPYMYQPSSHVTHSRIDGYGATFETRAKGIPFTGLRGGPARYVDYHYGTEYARERLNFPGYERGVNGTTFDGAEYVSKFNETRYLTVSQAAYEREVKLYDGFRYPQSGFRELETSPSVNRIRSNDGLRVYLIEGNGDEQGAR